MNLAGRVACDCRALESFRFFKNPFAISSRTSEAILLMQSRDTAYKAEEKTPPVPTRRVIAEPDFTGTPQPIRELVTQEHFPQCLLGAYVDIQGFAGVVVEIVKDSIRVRPPEGMTQRFNIHRLKTLYGPPVYTEPVPSTANVERAQADAGSKAAAAEPEAPPRVCIADPDFSAPIGPINEYASRPDFPQGAYGKHVDILGYTGVVVEIVRGSLKIQSPAGITRSYNVEALKKLYGKS
jgi:hypothetical protein